MKSPASTTFVAYEAIPGGARVKLRSDGKIELADAADREIGVAVLYGGKTSYAAGEPVGVDLINAPGTVVCLAGDTIAIGDVVLRAADGKVTAGGVGTAFGVAFAAAEDTDQVEVLRDPNLSVTVADAAVTSAKLANGVADLIPDFSVAIANAGSPNGNATVTLQAKDAQGNNLATRAVFEVWFAATAYAAPADLGTLTASTGTILKEDTDDALARVVTDATGAAVLVLDTAADGTVHVHATINGLAKTANVAVTGN